MDHLTKIVVVQAKIIAAQPHLKARRGTYEWRITVMIKVVTVCSSAVIIIEDCVLLPSEHFLKICIVHGLLNFDAGLLACTRLLDAAKSLTELAETKSIWAISIGSQLSLC